VEEEIANKGCTMKLIKKNSFVKFIAPYVFYIIFSNKIKNKGKNNIIKTKGALLKNTKILIKGNNNEIIFEAGCRLINCTVLAYGDNCRLYINKFCRIENTIFWFEDNANTISIDSNTTIEGGQLSVAENGLVISIGEDCMFSKNIAITTTDSHSIIDKSSGRRINKPANVTIGDHVWLGVGCHILKGVSIGNNSIIGAGSVVTKSVPEYSIAAGNPVRNVKSNISWLRERI
jgi:acetyltransferase-like isoleucine patch superfamily enzyme